MLRVDNISKRFGPVRAVQHMTFTVERGAIYGFVGPNGAGKTTAMKMIATLLPLDSGRIFLEQVDVVADPYQARQRIGYMPDFFGVYDDLKVTEYLEFYADCYRVPQQGRRQLLDDLLGLVNLSHKRDEYVDSLSRGMKQRLCLARCLVHDPELLILDEPASGLDPRARVEMRDLLQELQRRGKTILISSHILPELAEMCTHIGIVRDGQLVLSGPVDQVLRRQDARVMELRTAGDPGAAAAAAQGQPGVGQVWVEDGMVHVTLDGGDQEAAALLGALVQAGVPVVHFTETRSSLEQVFLDITGGDRT